MKISTSDGIAEFDTVEVKSVEELAHKACSSNISTSVFKDGYRNISNFLFADCIGLDIDNDKEGTPTLNLDDAKRIFSGFKHVILATRSHNVPKKGITAERFRIILFPDVQIDKANDFYATWFWLKDQFPWIDNQCKDPSRFWFQHKEILSFAEEGRLIPCIHYTEPVKPTKEGRPVLPGERGELSKSALQFLAFGVGPGSRNGTVYKVAREFQQALFEHEETEVRIIDALERNQVISSDFTEAEAKLTIRSAFSKDAKHAPRIAEIKPRAFVYSTLATLLQNPDKEEDWLVEGLLLRGGVSIVVGMPKIGKTTLVRQLEKCIMRGEKFLDRKTFKGSIAHYSFDEKAKTAKRHYKTLGLLPEDPMILHFGSMNNENYLKEFEEDLMQKRPALVVVDTLFDLVDSDDVNNYGQIKKQLGFFNNLAEKSGCHIMFIHHQTKPNEKYGTGNGHSVLGSTAIFGSVDCCLIFEPVPGSSSDRLLKALGRSIEDFEKVQLTFNKKTMLYELIAKPAIDPDKGFF